jgi:hypothetical protein
MNTAEHLYRYCRKFISEIENVHMDTAERLCIAGPVYEYFRTFISILQKVYVGTAESSYGYCRKFACYRTLI